MELKPARLRKLVSKDFLLIVPYGIETADVSVSSLSRFRLLIVPYGIETTKDLDTVVWQQTFNCTLWN